MEPSNATTSPVVRRCSFIMPKRIAIDSTFGLAEDFEDIHNYVEHFIISRAKSEIEIVLGA